VRSSASSSSTACPTPAAIRPAPAAPPGGTSRAAASAPVTPAKPVASPQSADKTRQGLVDSSDDEDEEKRSKPAPKPPLEAAEVEVELLPLVAENEKVAQKCFERYVRRLPEGIAGATDTAWDKLQKRANEQCLGGHVGKLDFFWICRPGSDPTPDAADGLVCFQFVQGFATNFARVFHLSVVDRTGDGLVSLLPSAIFEVRRLIFETLPVDSIRAIVLAGEDDSGRIYVDDDVEVAYQRCRFRWFQLTQNLRRTRSGIRRKKKLKPSTRFLVLNAMRQEHDPKAPGSSIGRRPAMLLKNTDSVGAPDGELIKKTAVATGLHINESMAAPIEATAEFASEFTAW